MAWVSRDRRWRVAVLPKRGGYVFEVTCDKALRASGRLGADPHAQLDGVLAEFGGPPLEEMDDVG